ncbi:MAG: hypothetical protein WBA13_11960 [Microcoleaceae cyanobacterium]
MSFVTIGAQAINKYQVQNLVESALWGMGKVVALEHPELRVVQVDLDPEATVEEQVEVLKGELLATEEPVLTTSAPELQTQPREDQIAFREQMRYVARLSPLARPNSTEKGEQESLRFRDKDNRLIILGHPKYKRPSFNFSC